jgi:hypothetical protein
MMNIELFLDAAVSGVPLLFVVWGVVQIFKLFKRPDGKPLFSGNLLLILSFAWGLLIGSGYMIFMTRPPISADWWPVYGYWFGVLIYGISLGILAAVFWEALKAIVDKAVAKLIEKAQV